LSIRREPHRHGRRGLAAILAVAVLAAGARAAPLDDLRECAAQATHQMGSKQLRAICPLLDQSLEAAGLAKMLDDQGRSLNAAALEDLLALALRYDIPAKSGPSTSSLAAIAAQVNGRPVARDPTWWERFKSSLSRWFSQSEPGASGWLDRWLQRLLQAALLNSIAYACMALVVAAAVALVLNEMRVAGRLRRSRHAASNGTYRSNSTYHQPAAAPGPPPDARAGVAQLLGLLVARLVQTGRLSSERALTHRELISRSKFDTALQHDAFARLANAAESILYGPSRPSMPLQPIMQEGHALLEQLADAAAPRSK
jgi:hypothetical protein